MGRGLHLCAEHATRLQRPVHGYKEGLQHTAISSSPDMGSGAQSAGTYSVQSRGWYELLAEARQQLESLDSC